MNTNDLLRELSQTGINEKACLVLPPHRVEGALCLTHEADGLWLVPLVERGDVVVKEYFNEQGPACRFFLIQPISKIFRWLVMKNCWKSQRNYQANMDLRHQQTTKLEGGFYAL